MGGTVRFVVYEGILLMLLRRWEGCLGVFGGRSRVFGEGG